MLIFCRPAQGCIYSQKLSHASFFIVDEHGPGCGAFTPYSCLYLRFGYFVSYLVPACSHAVTSPSLGNLHIPTGVNSDRRGTPVITCLGATRRIGGFMPGVAGTIMMVCRMPPLVSSTVDVPPVCVGSQFPQENKMCSQNDCEKKCPIRKVYDDRKKNVQSERPCESTWNRDV